MSTINKSFNWLNNLSWIYLLIIGMSLTGGYFLWERYQEQLFSYLPYMILLLCPLMHVFMHKGHGGGHGKHDDHQKGQD